MKRTALGLVSSNMFDIKTQWIDRRRTQQKGKLVRKECKAVNHSGTTNTY